MGWCLALHRVEVSNDIARNDGMKLVLGDIVAQVRVGTKEVDVCEPKERLFIGLSFRKPLPEQLVVSNHVDLRSSVSAA